MSGRTFDEDLDYVRDLGLIARTDPVRVANPIYREVIARVLSNRVQAQVTVSPHRFVLSDGRLDFRGCWRSSPTCGWRTASS